MLAIIIFGNIGNCNFQRLKQFKFPEMLVIITSRNNRRLDFQKLYMYHFQKCWQLYFPEILALVIAINVGSSNFQKCWQLQFPERLKIIISRNVGNYNFQKC